MCDVMVCVTSRCVSTDSYVKTYLVEGRKTIQKKKSQVVKASTDPVYRRKIKYSACNVHGRHMRVRTVCLCCPDFFKIQDYFIISSEKLKRG